MCRTISFHAYCLIVCVPFFSTALAIAVDSANTVRNPDFNTVTPPGQSAAWTSIYYSFNGIPLCQDGITIEQNIAGHAQCVQLNPLYRYPNENGGYYCSNDYSCDPAIAESQLVQLVQTDIPCAQSDYVEVAFDFLLVNRMPSCAPVCSGVPNPSYAIALVKVIENPLPGGDLIGDDIGVGEINHLMLSDVESLGVWSRQRIGMQRKWTSSTLTLKVLLVPGAQTEGWANVYGVAMNLDNVSVRTFDGSCERQQWVCEKESVPVCHQSVDPPYGIASHGVQTPIAVNDPYALFRCNRPCTFCIADIDENGVVNGGDLTYVLGGWGSTDPVADLDHNGTVNGADLTLLLSQWGCED